MTREDWAAWVIALHRPTQRSGGWVPDGIELPGWWRWAWHLHDRYGAQIVTHTTPQAIVDAPEGLTTVEGILADTGQLPAPSDPCWQGVGRPCTGACRDG